MKMLVFSPATSKAKRHQCFGEMYSIIPQRGYGQLLIPVVVVVVVVAQIAPFEKAMNRKVRKIQQLKTETTSPPILLSLTYR